MECNQKFSKKGCDIQISGLASSQAQLSGVATNEQVMTKRSQMFSKEKSRQRDLIPRYIFNKLITLYRTQFR